MLTVNNLSFFFLCPSTDTGFIHQYIVVVSWNLSLPWLSTGKISCLRFSARNFDMIIAGSISTPDYTNLSFACRRVAHHSHSSEISVLQIAKILNKKYFCCSDHGHYTICSQKLCANGRPGDSPTLFNSFLSFRFSPRKVPSAHIFICSSIVKLNRYISNLHAYSEKNIGTESCAQPAFFSHPLNQLWLFRSM